MGEVTIRLKHNPKTGKKVLTIEYESDADLLPHEHEKDHKRLVEKLLGQPVGDDIGEIRVERVGEKGAPEEQESAPEAAAGARREKLGEKG